MQKYLIFGLVVCITSIVSFSFGFVLGDLDRKEREFQVEVAIEKQIAALERASDANMYSSEPYNSFMFSIILLESIIENPEMAHTNIKSILVQELRSRKDSVRSYCGSRATQMFRSSCEKAVDKAEQLVEQSGK
ncbi:hypothetical protein KO489_12550 [Reinekea forsetii]|nr:hypothetical protein [Reinekea forsetii]